MMPMVRDLDLTVLRLAKGAHGSPSEGLCAMEAAAFIAGRDHTDHPPCVSPVIGAFVRSWNDGMNDEDRQMLKPYISRILDTNTGDADDETRAWLATDWLCRVQTPAWLRLAGLEDHARAVESLARIVDPITAREAERTLDDAAWAASAAWAAWAAWAASAAWDASAASAAWAASAASAAWAAKSALRPTVVALQKSALGLLDQMIAVGQSSQPSTPAAR